VKLPENNHRPENRMRRVTVKEACAYARMGKSRLFELIAAEKIDAYKDGRSTLVDLNSIDRYQAKLPKRAVRRVAAAG